MNLRREELTEEMVEVLEAVWTLEEIGENKIERLRRNVDTSSGENALASLEAEQLISVEESGIVRLLPEGKDMAREIIRRHRLAERLICDALGVQVEESEDAACEFEHLLAEGISSSICTLLGHPRLCPHNRPIPEGECCRRASEEFKPIIIPCDQLRIGDSGRVAYVCAKEHALISRLSNLGVQPGVPVRLLQKWPSCVIQCEETEIAIEQAVARSIYVRVASQ